MKTFDRNIIKECLFNAENLNLYNARKLETMQEIDTIYDTLAETNDAVEYSMMLRKCIDLLDVLTIYKSELGLMHGEEDIIALRLELVDTYLNDKYPE